MEWPDHGTIHYQLACYLALAEEAERALRHLEKAVAAEPAAAGWAAVDTDLQSLRGDPRYERIVTVAANDADPVQPDVEPAGIQGRPWFRRSPSQPNLTMPAPVIVLKLATGTAELLVLQAPLASRGPTNANTSVTSRVPEMPA